MEEETVTIPTELSIADAVRRLSEVIDTGWHKHGLKPRLAGEVSGDAVCVYRRRPYARNGIYPRFVGRFSVVNGNTVLEGRVGPSSSTSIGGVLVYSILGIVGAWSIFAGVFKGVGWKAIAGVIMCLIMGAAVWAWSRLAKANADIDAQFLRSDLERALGHHGV